MGVVSEGGEGRNRGGSGRFWVIPGGFRWVLGAFWGGFSVFSDSWLEMVADWRVWGCFRLFLGGLRGVSG